MALPSLTTVLNFFEERFTSGRSALFGDVQDIAAILVTFEVVFAGLYLALGHSSDLRAIARKILTIGFFFYVIRYYGDILRWMVDGFLYAGEKAGSGVAVDFATLRDPGAVFIRGMQVARPLSDKLFANIDASYFGILSVDSLLLLICMVLTVFSFAVMSIQVFITYLEYLLIATAGFIIIPFGIFKPTAFLAERVFGAIISFGIKLMILALIIGVSDSFIQTVVMPVEVTWQQAIELSVIALALAFLALHAPGVAQSLLTGSPHLSAGTIAATTAGASYLGSRAATSGSRVAGGLTSATSAAAGAMYGGGVARAASLGSASEAKTTTGKVARGLSKSLAFGVGSVEGIVSGGASAMYGRAMYGKNGSPNGGKAYRQEMGDKTAGQSLQSASGAYSANQSSGGVIGSFNAGRYSVPQYRSMDKESRKSKAEETDKDTVKKARSDNSNAETQEPKTDSTKDDDSKEKL